MSINTQVTYTLNDDVSKRLAAIESKLKHFDNMLDKTDKKVASFGSSASFGKAFASGGLQNAVSTLENIPGLNTGIISSAAGLANPYVAAGAAIVAVGAFAADATRDAIQFNDGMAKVNITARLSKQELGALGDRLAALPRYGTDLLAIPESFNRIISATGDVNISTDIMAVSLKAARANMGDLDVTANALVNTMGSAGDEFANATAVSDMLTKTMQLGNAEFNDLATYLPRIIPYAKQLGFTTNEVAGAMAMFTSKGQSTEQTAMLLQNAFTALGDGKKMANIQKFVDVFDANGKIKPFAEIFTNLKKGIDGMTNKELAEFKVALDLDAQAGAAFQGLIVNSELLTKNIGQIKNASGETTKALAAGGKTAADNIALLQEKWQNFKLDLGKKIAPYWDSFTSGLVKIWTWFERIEEKTHVFSKVIGIAFKLAYGAFIRFYNAADYVYTKIKDLVTEVKERFPNAFDTAARVVGILTAHIKNLVFTAVEAFDALTNLYTFNFDGLTKNVQNFKNHDYASGNDKTQFTNKDVNNLGEKTKQDAYDKLVKIYGKKQVDANAAKYGITIPGTKVAAPAATPTNDSKFDLTDAGKDKDKDKKKKPKEATNADNLHAISGDKGNRSVIVTIKSLVENLTIQTNNISNLSASAMRKAVEEALVMAVRDSELALSSQ